MSADVEAYKEYVISKCSLASLQDLELTAVLGLVGEAGEIADLIKKDRFHYHIRERNYSLKELGDLFFYFTLMLEVQGYTLENVIDTNMRKLDERYPKGFDPHRSMNRE